MKLKIIKYNELVYLKGCAGKFKIPEPGFFVLTLLEFPNNKTKNHPGFFRNGFDIDHRWFKIKSAG